MLLLQARSLADWRTAAETTHRMRWLHLQRQADSYLTWQPPAEHPRDSITYIGMAVANLGLAHLVGGQPDHLEGMRRWLAVALGYPHWGRERRPDHDLDAAWLLFGLGLVYDWLGTRLPPAERDALREKLLLQGRRLYEYAREREGLWWSSAYWQNHNWICYAGLATAAYALQAEHSEAADWGKRALENYYTVLSSLPEDGSDYEGPVYWCYSLPWILIYCDLLREQTGIDLHDCDFLRRTFYYRLYVSGPNLVDTANHGDCHDRRSAHSAAIYYRLASLYRNGHAQWLAQHLAERGEWEREAREGLLRPGLAAQAFLEFLWYDPTVPSEPIDQLPTVRAFPDLGLLSVRSGWDPRATFLALKCGAPSGRKAWALGHALDRARGWQTLKASHAHPDENSFVLIRGDDYLVVDEGYSQAKRTAHHSTVLVDGQGQYHENAYNAFEGLEAGWGGRLETWFAAGGIAYARGEAAGAYEPDLGLTRFTRQWLLAGDGVMLICDDLEALEARSFAWLLQTDAPPQPVAESQYLVEAGRSRMRIVVLLPAEPAGQVSSQEIVSYPSSAIPDWVLRRKQHTLALATPTSCKAARFLVVLSVEDVAAATPQVSRAAATRGDAAQIVTPTGRWIAGVARDARGIQAGNALEGDAAWAVAECSPEGELQRLAAGQATHLLAAGRLRLAADSPVDLAVDGSAGHIRAAQSTWLSLWAWPRPDTILLNGRPVTPVYDERLSMLRLQVPAGETQVRLSHGGER